jgi:hypothetical protein
LNDVQFKLEKDFTEGYAEKYTLVHIPFLRITLSQNPAIARLLSNVRRCASGYTLLRRGYFSKKRKETDDAEIQAVFRKERAEDGAAGAGAAAAGRGAAGLGRFRDHG